MFGSLTNSTASILAPYSFVNAKIFSTSLGFHGSSCLCNPSQLATEINNFALIALTKSNTPIHCSFFNTFWNPSGAPVLSKS